MSVETIKRRIERLRLRRAKMEGVGPLPTIVLVPLRREGEPPPTEDECAVIWKQKERNHEHR